MPKTPQKPKDTDPLQRERFEQAARELGVELDEEKLKETLKRLGNTASHEARDDKKPYRS